MRVLFVTRDLRVVQGTGLAERTRQMAREAAAQGHDVHVLTLALGGSGVDYGDMGAATVGEVPCWQRRFFVPQPRSRAMAAAVAEADVLCLMGYWGLLNPMVAAAARARGRPYVVCPAGEWCASGRSLWIKRAFERTHGRALVGGAAAMLAVTGREAAEFRRNGIPGERVWVVPNGVRLPQHVADAAAPSQPVAATHVVRRILFLGRLHPIKGPDLLLAAFAGLANEYPDAELVLAGPDDGLAVELQQRVAALGLGARVSFPGFVAGDARFAAMRQADLVVIPSRREAMSLVVLEAGACSRPVLMTDACGFPELAEVGGGKIVAASAEALQDGLRTMLDRPADLPAMGAALAGLVRRRYAWSSIVADLMGRFRPLVHEPLGTAA